MSHPRAAAAPARAARTARAACAAVVAALALAACTSSPSDDEPTATGPAPVTVTYAYEQEFSSYNNNTATERVTKNSVVLNQVLRGFWFYNPSGTAEPDTEFGSYEKVSDEPLTVRYTVNPNAVWSDGEPIDCDDFVLTWAANSGKWLTGKKDPDTGAPLTAFTPAGNAGYDLARMPQCQAGQRGFTLVYTTPFADWEALFGAGEILPAHIVQQRSGEDVLAALASDDVARVQKIADVWNTGWVFTPGEFDAAIAPSAGPYRISGWQAGQSLTLSANPAWWGTPPAASSIVIRIIAQDQQAQALRNGEIQVMDPQPNPELLQQLEQIGPSVTVSTYDQFTWEHLDFNFAGVFADKALRTAFAKCVPRQTIVDNLIKPQNPEAEILQSRFLLPFQPGYDRLANLGGQEFSSVDIPGAKAIVEAKGKVGMPVVIRYQTPNPRRAAEVDLIRDSCGKAGFRVQDGGSSTFFSDEIGSGDFDLALYAYQGSALVTQNNGIYDIGGGGNVIKYRNRDVTTWLKQLNTELDPERQMQLQVNMDRQLWADVATLPLFAFPGVMAVSNSVTGVEANPSQNGLTWNSQGWNLKR